MKNEIVEKVREIFYIYRKNKLLIENYATINNSLNGNIHEKDIKKYKEFISVVDRILDELDEVDQWILKNIFVDRKEKCELNYSDSTFYWRLRRASSNFMEMIKW